MQPSNPACYECEATKSKLHHWIMRDDKTAYCIKCNVELTKAEAADVFRDYEK